MYTYAIKVRLRKRGSIGEWYRQTFTMSFARKMTNAELRMEWYAVYRDRYEVHHIESISHLEKVGE